MATYLLTWNPDEWFWEDLEESSQEVNLGNSIFIEWSCGNTKKIKEGDRVFILRQGVEPKGICASGTVIKGSFEALNFRDKLSQYIELEFDTLLNPETEKIIPRDLLDNAKFSGVHWDTQRSGITINDAAAAELENHWTQFSNKTKLSNADELEAKQQRVEAEGYFNANNLEDARKKVITSIVQRRGQSEFRRKLLKAYGGRCSITNCDVEASIAIFNLMGRIE